MPPAKIMSDYLICSMTFMVLSKIIWIITYIPLLPYNLIKIWLSFWILYPSFKVSEFG